MEQTRFSGPIFVVLAFFAVSLVAPAQGNGTQDNTAQGDAAERLDWGEWLRMPVFSDGRIMPLDSYARQIVQVVCGTSRPVLDGPDGLRAYSPAELLLSWLVEPERWDHCEFIVAGDPSLRAALGLAGSAGDGRRLRFISPDEVENNPTLGRLWGELQERYKKEGSKFRLNHVEKKLRELVDAYDAFRQLTFDPHTSDAASRRFFNRIHPTIKAWRNVTVALQQTQQLDRDETTHQAMVQSGEALQQIAGAAQGDDFSLEKVEKPVAAFRKATERLADHLADGKDPLVAAMTAALRRQAVELHGSLYDNGACLRLAPSLNTAAMEDNRVPGDDAQPWLSVQALLIGSDDLLSDYPQKELRAVRAAFAEAKKVYLDRAGADRPQRFAAAMQQFVEQVRAFGEAMQPLREELPIRNRDQALLDGTAYPAPGAIRAELLYDRLAPFFWSWTISLAAVVCLCFSWGKQTKFMFWLGAIVLVVAQAFTVTGFALRMIVTGLVPLTGMFETVVFVALGVAVLGLAFTIQPLLQAGSREAWRFTSLRPMSAPAKSSQPHAGRLAMRVILIVLQAGLAAIVFALIVRLPGRPESGIFDLLPPAALGASLPNVSDVLVWLAGLAITAATVWLAPRCAATVFASLYFVPRSWFGGIAAPMEEVMRRRFFVLGGAAIACIAVVLASYAPATVMKRNLGAVAPILRDNHWLVVHVVTIMASYASALIALVLGNMALGYYLLGSYRSVPAASVDGVDRPTQRRPPKACATLAGFIYKNIQITVLLLTAGTILGALWADKSWGRFWGWDPKEVWALVSLLVYLVILHARAAGWAGDFGLAAASVLGATSVLFTWYGVNFVLNSGMHAYGAGSGGGWQVAAAVILNWLFLLAAWLRNVLECGRSTVSDSPMPQHQAIVEGASVE